MFERIFDELRMSVRSVIDMAADRLERRARRILGSLIWILLIVPIWLFSVFFLLCALFLYLSNMDTRAIDALYTGLIGLGVSGVSLMIVMSAGRK